ncbi:MAG: VanZ family protein [Bacillota bacterium]
MKALVWLLPLGYMGLIWYLSGHPSDAVIDTGLAWDRQLKEALHLVQFGVLYVLLLLAWGTGQPVTAKARLGLALVAAAYGLVDEVHQYFVPTRSFALIDLAKDWIGVGAAWYLSD